MNQTARIVVAVVVALTTGLPRTDAWWIPAHVLLGIGIGAATIVGALPASTDQDQRG